MENRSHALIAGLFTVLLGIAATLSLWWFGGETEQTRDYLVVTAKSVSGLNPQAQVRYRGISVGRVESIDLDRENPRNILIRIRIRDDVPVTEGAVARLGYQGVTGIAHIQLDYANTGNGKAGDSTRAPLLVDPKGGLPRIAMEDSFVEALTDTGADTLKEIHNLVANINRFLNPENRKAMAHTLNNLASASDNAREASMRLRQALSEQNLHALQAILKNTEHAAGQAGHFFAEARGLVTRLQSVSDKLGVTLDNLNGPSSSATLPSLNELGRDLAAASRQLSRVLQMLEDQPQSLILGKRKQMPGPGEAGFVEPAESSDQGKP